MPVLALLMALLAATAVAVLIYGGPKSAPVLEHPGPVYDENGHRVLQEGLRRRPHG
jgi:hypothetical protein